MMTAIWRCAALVASLHLAACATAPNAAESEGALPLVLTPVAQTRVIDDRAAYRTLFCRLLNDPTLPAAPSGTCADWLRQLGDEPVTQTAAVPAAAAPAAPARMLLLVAGIYGECIQSRITMFADALPTLAARGYTAMSVPVRGRASSRHNAGIIRDFVLNQAKPAPGEKLLIVAYSKGLPDTLEAIVGYPEIRPLIAGVIAIAGVVNGTPLADRGERIYDKTIGLLPYAQCPPIDDGEIRSLTRAERLPWLAAHPLPPEIAYFSLVALPGPDRVSEALKLPYFALSAVDGHNDSQVIYSDAVIPGSHLLGYANADHWAIALPFVTQDPLIARTLVTRNDFPRAQLLTAAVLYADAVIRQGRP